MNLYINAPLINTTKLSAMNRIYSVINCNMWSYIHLPLVSSGLPSSANYDERSGLQNSHLLISKPSHFIYIVPCVLVMDLSTWFLCDPVYLSLRHKLFMGLITSVLIKLLIMLWKITILNDNYKCQDMIKALSLCSLTGTCVYDSWIFIKPKKGIATRRLFNHNKQNSNVQWV